MTRTAILALVLLASGCTEEAAAPPTEQGGEAAGEVLGGSISDAMIPLEQLQSQAPLAPRAAPSAAEVDAAQPNVAADAEPESQGAEAAPAPEATLAE